MTYVLVPGDAGVDALIAFARAISERVIALHIGTPEQAAAVAAAGVDAVYTVDPDTAPAEGYASAVADFVATQPGSLIAGRDPPSRVLLGAAAAALTAPVISGVLETRLDAGRVQVRHQVSGGIAERTIEVSGPVALMVDGGATTPDGQDAAVEQLPVSRPTIETISWRQSQQAPPLNAASRVVGIGRGLKRREDLPLLQGLADALGAELGCTRPLAEGLDWLGRDRYIGVSGQQIAPRLYVAVGISGQLQHLAGARNAEVIVAINTDEQAPIAKDADYLLVGDLYELVPALSEALGGP